MNQPRTHRVPAPCDRPSKSEYLKRTSALYPSESEFRPPLELERAAFDALIDYRLGTSFPPERREALWQVKRRTWAYPLGVLLAHAAAVVSPRLSSLIMERLSQRLVSLYRGVLSHDEAAELIPSSLPPRPQGH